MLEFRNASLASLRTSLESSLSSSINQMAGHTLGHGSLGKIAGHLYVPGKIEEHAGTEELPLLWLLDSQREDALKAKEKDGDGKVPVVGVSFECNYPEK